MLPNTSSLPLFNVCFILGGPGAGKGTICSKIVEDYDFVHLSAGELLRRACDTPGSLYWEQIHTHMKNGSIVPAKITCDLLFEAMCESFKVKKSTNFLIDGFPRNEENRVVWDEFIGPKTSLKRVILLECSDENCIERCLNRCSGRVDDNLNTLKKRLEVFKQQCSVVVDFYDSQNQVSRIDANQSKQDVYESLKKMMATIVT